MRVRTSRQAGGDLLPARVTRASESGRRVSGEGAQRLQVGQHLGQRQADTFGDEPRSR